MFENISFPIVRNHTVIPVGFRSDAVQMHGEVFSGLEALHCHNVIWVDSPAGWGILRGGKSEVPHLDIFLVHSGGISWWTRQSHGVSRGGQVMLIPSWVDRKLWTVEGGSHIYIRLETPEMPSAFPGIVSRGTGYMDEVVFLVKRLLLNPEARLREADYRRHLGECLAILLQRELNNATPDAMPCRAEKLVSLIREASPEQLDTRTIARHFGMSLSACRSFCLQTFGKSLGRVIEEILMSRAQALLTYSDLPIDEVARQLGYADRFSFSKAFLRVKHLTPGAFRRRLEQGGLSG